MFTIILNLRKNLEDAIVEYIDIDFTLWLSWLLMPLLITFLLPLMIMILLYFTALVLYIYELYGATLRDAYETDWRKAAQSVIAAVWDAHGWIWHGYEIIGLENIPKDEPVLFVYYHGAIPLDLFYFMARVFLLTSNLIHSVADKFLFKCPGWSILADELKIVAGTVQSCSAILKEGNSLAISPGGVYEAQFGDSYYQLLWKKRVGFAKVALDAKVCIIPMFTRNIREAFRVVSWGRRIWLRIYAATRLPLVPIYGGFPVKLTTYVGKPIPYDGTLTPEELQIKVADALNNLISEHQRIPGSISLALLERIYTPKKKQS